jgi:hypothetical protein
MYIRRDLTLGSISEFFSGSLAEAIFIGQGVYWAEVTHQTKSGAPFPDCIMLQIPRQLALVADVSILWPEVWTRGVVHRSVYRAWPCGLG